MAPRASARFTSGAGQPVPATPPALPANPVGPSRPLELVGLPLLQAARAHRPHHVRRRARARVAQRHASPPDRRGLRRGVRDCGARDGARASGQQLVASLPDPSYSSPALPDGPRLREFLRECECPLPTLALAAPTADRRLARQERDTAHVTRLGDRLREGIMRRIDHCVVNGSTESRYPGNINISFAFVEGESLLMALKVARPRARRFRWAGSCCLLAGCLACVRARLLCPARCPHSPRRPPGTRRRASGSARYANAHLRLPPWARTSRSRPDPRARPPRSSPSTCCAR